MHVSVWFFSSSFIIAFLMRSSEQSLAMRSSILFWSGSIYKSSVEFSVVVQRGDTYSPSTFLTKEEINHPPERERFVDASNTTPGIWTTIRNSRGRVSYLIIQIIVLLCDCLLQQLKPLTQVGKLKLQWIRHNVFIVFCHCLFFLSFHVFFLFLEWLSWYLSINRSSVSFLLSF